MALALTSEEELYPAVGRALFRAVRFVPRVTLHGGTASHSATSYSALMDKSLLQLVNEVR